jgi:hypothetical protein
MPKSYPAMPQKLMPSGGAVGGTTVGATNYPSTPSPGNGGSQGGGPTSGSASLSQPFNRQAFTKSYADMVARTWTDDQYLELLLAEPVGTLAKAGISTATGAVIRIIQHKLTGSGKIEDQIDAWIEGNRTGLYDLFLPLKPDDIDFSGGSGDPSAEGGGCCCCPCCCCT